MSRSRQILTPEKLAEAFGPLPACGRLWIAYSGGLDSHVLLHAVAALRFEPDVAVSAVHLDHGLQPASASWAVHCREVCRGLHIPLTVRRLDIAPAPGDSLEAAARTARYAAFAELLRPGDLLATAQHRDDQAETLLLSLLRGSGVHGLAGMAARAPLGAGTLLRPLLAFGRDALEAYARREGLVWIEDPSNADVRFDRNLLRARVLPLLRQRWPAADAMLARAAALCGEAADVLDEAADRLLPDLAGSRSGTLSIAAMRELADPRKRLVLRRWIASAGLPPPGADRLRRVLSESLAAAADRDPLVAWPGCEIRRHRDDLFALTPLPTLPPEAPIPWNGREPLPLPEPLGWLLPPSAGGPGEQVSVAFRVQGLRCRRPGRTAAALQELYRVRGVPSWLRGYVPLLLAGGSLRAVAGVAACDPSWDGLVWQGHPWVGADLLQETASVAQDPSSSG